jgi:hypothetical protein
MAIIKYTAPGLGITNPDSVPDQFTFTDQVDVPIATVTTSDSITVEGTTLPAAISISGANNPFYQISGGTWVNTAGSVSPGSTVKVRHESSAFSGQEIQTVLTIGGVSDTFSTTTVQVGTDSVQMSVATADVPPSSLVYGRTINIGDTLVYYVSTARDGGGAGTVALDTEGTPTITGTHGTYPVTFNLNGGGDEEKIVSHIDVDAVEALFNWRPALDADGWSVIPTPESTARLLYIDPVNGDNAAAATANGGLGYYTTATIPGTHYRTDPGAVIAYEDRAAARAKWRDNEGDYLLFKRGTTSTITAAMGGWTLWAGKSHTFPHVVCDYGSGALPVIRPHPDYGDIVLFGTSTDDNYNHFYNINFHSQYRDPDHVDFVGFGLTQFGIDALDFFAPSFQSPPLTGHLVEGCIFNYCGCKNGSSIDNLIVFRRNVVKNNYSEAEQKQGIFGFRAYLVEDNLLYHNGWRIARDAATYGSNSGNFNHEGLNGATTFTTTGGNFTGREGHMVRKNNSQYGRVDTVPTASSFTATAQASNGGGPMTFDTGDTINIRSLRTAGQGNGENHNSYLAPYTPCIYRNNLVLESPGAGMKLVTYREDPSTYTGTHDGAGPTDTTFTDAGAAFGATDALVGGPIINTTGTDRYGIIQENTATTFRAFYTVQSESAEFGTSTPTGTRYMEFNAGDTIAIDDPPTINPPCNDYCFYNNYFAGNSTDITADLNFGNRSWTPRHADARFMDNVMTKTNYLQLVETVGATSFWLRYWGDGCVVGNNIITTVPESYAYGILHSRIATGQIVSRNIMYDLGLPSGTSVVSRGALVFNSDFYDQSNIQVLYNDIQMQNTDNQPVGDWQSSASVSSTWEGNRYFSLRPASSWWEIEDIDADESTWVAETGETGYTLTSVTYTNAQTHEGYMTDIAAGATTIEELANAAEAMMLGTWDNDYYAPYIVANFKLGYKE